MKKRRKSEFESFSNLMRLMFMKQILLDIWEGLKGFAIAGAVITAFFAVLLALIFALSERYGWILFILLIVGFAWFMGRLARY
jgi:hypothetical protein